MEKFIINIGRQLGSGGREIGKLLASNYGIAYYDKELIRIASEESGLCSDLFEKADEHNRRSIVGGVFGMRFPFVGEGTIGQGNYLNNDTLFKIQSDVIRKLAQKESCIFIGRCADYILREHPYCINIFISASSEDRVARICKNYEVKEQKAERLMEEADRRRADYYNFYSLKQWGHASSYDLCINSSILGIQETTLFIQQFIEKKLNSSSTNF